MKTFYRYKIPISINISTRSSVQNSVHLKRSFFILCKMHFQCFVDHEVQNTVVKAWCHKIVESSENSLFFMDVQIKFSYFALPHCKNLESGSFLSCLSIAGDQCNITRQCIALSIPISITIQLKSILHLLYIKVCT